MSYLNELPYWQVYKLTGRQFFKVPQYIPSFTLYVVPQIVSSIGDINVFLNTNSYILCILYIIVGVLCIYNPRYWFYICLLVWYKTIYNGSTGALDTLRIRSLLHPLGHAFVKRRRILEVCK
jgi:hypothetical protein